MRRPLVAPGLLVVLALTITCGAPPSAPTPRDGPAPAIVGAPTIVAAPPNVTAPPAVDAGPPLLAPSAEVTAMLFEVSPARLRADVDRLAAFGTRHTLSAVDDPARGIGAARQWIRGELEAAAASSADERGPLAMTVDLDVHRVAPDGARIDVDVDVVNVVAVLPGLQEEARGRRYYVIGHYDSRASDPKDRTSDAPGANDDGSGTALTIELARVMARHRFDATIVFMTTAGEEQGLVGARRHAAAARAAGVDVRAVLSNDIVGDPTDPDGPPQRDRIRLFSEGLPLPFSDAALAEARSLGGLADGPSRQLARHIADVADAHALAVRPLLVARADRFLRGGDHTAFTEQGYAAVRFTEVAESYDHQHQDVRVEGARRFGDLPEFVDAEYLAEVARLNAAALAHLANAPSSPPALELVVDGLDTATTLRWQRSPEPDVVGYELLRRPSDAPRWETVEALGDVTEITTPWSKDHWLFAVRAVDRDGYRSPPAFPRLSQAPRP